MKLILPPVSVFLWMPVFWLLAVGVQLQAQIKPVPTPRTALLVGAWDYESAVFPRLPQAGIEHDLAGMKAVLEALGFEVTVILNPETSGPVQTAVKAFEARLKERGGTALFYFTGHGAEHAGKNYLVPTRDESLSGSADLEHRAFAANHVLDLMEASGTEVNLMFLDCCRNGLTKGDPDRPIAPMQVRGALVGYGTRSGDVADVTATGSPYTQALLKHLATPGISLPDMHTLVTAELVKSGSARRPGYYADLDAIYHLVPDGSAIQLPPLSLTPPPLAKLDPRLLKLRGFWQREEGGMIIAVRDVKADGKVTAGYTNPDRSPPDVNVGGASARVTAGKVTLTVTMDDVDYRGSRYDLTYDAASGTLQGSYRAQGAVPFRVTFFKTADMPD